MTGFQISLVLIKNGENVCIKKWDFCKEFDYYKIILSVNNNLV